MSAAFDRIKAGLTKALAHANGAPSAVREHGVDIHLIRAEGDYKAALRIASKLVDIDPAPGTPNGDRLDALATLIEKYEAKVT